MSCLDVMHRQTYGARQYSPTALYRQHHSHQKLVLYSKMQDWVESNPETKEESDKEQSPEAEYISSRCVLLTYFQGDIGSVVDEHFSRALSQSNFNPSSAASKPHNTTSSLWREGPAFPTNQKGNFPASFWSGSYQPPAPPCLTGSHPDFPPAAGAVFHCPDPPGWPGHGLHQPPTLPPSAEAWPYTLTSQVGSSYPLMHEVYPHVHHPHAHHHASHLDPRYGSLLVPAVRAARISVSQSEITKAETTAAASSWTGAFHGTLEVAQGVNLDPGLLHQEKNKEPTWF